VSFHLKESGNSSDESLTSEVSVSVHLEVAEEIVAYIQEQELSLDDFVAQAISEKIQGHR